MGRRPKALYRPGRLLHPLWPGDARRTGDRGGRNQRFCSAMCAEAELLERDTGILAKQDIARYAAQRFVFREKD